MSGLQHENDVEAWKSAQICALIFDQLEGFSEKQFFYMLSRNRSTCGVKPYVLAACNPDPDSFLAARRFTTFRPGAGAEKARAGLAGWDRAMRASLAWAREDA